LFAKRTSLPANFSLVYLQVSDELDGRFDAVRQNLAGNKFAEKSHKCMYVIEGRKQKLTLSKDSKRIQWARRTGSGARRRGCRRGRAPRRGSACRATRTSGAESSGSTCGQYYDLFLKSSKNWRF
jgi:hypothetical protein